MVVTNLTEESSTNVTGQTPCLEDVIAQTIHDTGLAHNFYNQNATALDSASDAMVVDISKKNATDFLGEAKKLMDALDVLQQVHPFVGDLRTLETLPLWDLTVKFGDGIKKDIEDCGNAIDKYYKSKFILKFFRSSHWASKFLKLCSSFSQRTQDLQLALNIRTTLRVDIAINKLEKLIQRPSEHKARFEKEVQMRGRKEKCYGSQEIMVELLKIAEHQEAHPQNTAYPEPSSKDVNKPASKTTSASRLVIEKSCLDALLLYELYADLHILLNENCTLFMFKLDRQTSDIKDAIMDSEVRIIWAFNNRFQQVKDPHLQYIWREMKWTTNVKVLYFIAELYDYYVNRFSHRRHDALRPQVTSDASSLMVQFPSPTPTVSVTSDSEGEDHEIPAVDPAYHELPAVDPADKWCLKYLSIFYVPSLSEGFNGNANSLAGVCRKHLRTGLQILDSMIYVQADVLPENWRCIARYLYSYAIHGHLHGRQVSNVLSVLLQSLEQRTRTWISRDWLLGVARLRSKYLVTLKMRHLQIMKLASTVILAERELESATQMIENILEGVSLRVEQLAESFRQQGNDPKVRFTCPGQITEDTEYWQTHNFGFDETELEIDMTALKFGPFSLTKDNNLLERLHFIAFYPGQQPQDTREEYIYLRCMNELHNTRNLWHFYIPPYLSLKDKERFDILSQEQPPTDIKSWNSLAELHMRRRLFESMCNTCHHFVGDVLHCCIDYECKCESLPVSNYEYPSEHKATHNMLVFRMSIPDVCYKRGRHYARNFLSACVPAVAPSEGLLDVQEDEPQTPLEGPERPPSTDTTQALADVSSTSLNLLGDDEELSGHSGVAFGGIAETSVVNGNGYICAECGVKLREIQTTIALCGDCAFRDVFNVVTAHHPHKHWLVKIKDMVEDAGGASDEPPNDSDETSSLSLRVDKLAAMVESRFAEQDRHLDALITQVDLLVHSLAGSTGKAQLPLESVSV
ncbi:uncharacterized protein EDB91DRAFT_1274269 [Suillus paluster]|uniref:uncharacterized protein n=1 Tax=Suillus paluster TaxID=48578 RepID=UPI001B866625|nr:uncharacterized protein EDB91DRAFT_1274269 [Suillus paluster]KAG1743666.1 hypothetical protein EDB91DRAFT_1274269 [Suillus paluster]